MTTAAHDRYLIDIDLSRGTISWSGRCEGCTQLVDGGHQLWIVGLPTEGEPRWQAISLDTETHSAAEPVDLDLAANYTDQLVPARGGLWFFDGKTVKHLDPVTGRSLGAVSVQVGSGYLCSHGGSLGVFVRGGHLWVHENDQLVARDPTTFVSQFSVSIPHRADVFDGPDGIWYFGVKAGPTTIELGRVDEATGALSHQQTFETTLSSCGDEPDVPVTPGLIVDIGGVWYLDDAPHVTAASPPNPRYWMFIAT